MEAKSDLTVKNSDNPPESRAARYFWQAMFYLVVFVIFYSFFWFVRYQILEPKENQVIASEYELKYKSSILNIGMKNVELEPKTTGFIWVFQGSGSQTIKISSLISPDDFMLTKMNGCPDLSLLQFKTFTNSMYTDLDDVACYGSRIITEQDGLIKLNITGSIDTIDTLAIGILGVKNSNLQDIYPLVLER